MEQPDWLEQLRAGDPGAMEGLLAQYGPMMEYIVRGVLSDPHEAEDCLAQVRARLWEKAASYDGTKAGAGTWITAICRNAAYDRLRARARREGRQGELSPELADPAPGPEEEVLRRERARGPAPGPEHPEGRRPAPVLPQVLLSPTHRPHRRRAGHHAQSGGGAALPNPQTASGAVRR